MSEEPRGGFTSDLFMSSHVSHRREDGKTILRHAVRCRWCLAPTTGHDQRENDPMLWMHALPCAVRDLIERWKEEGNSPAVVAQYDAIIEQLDAADNRRPS
jgi:hypothetical protein